MEDNKRPTVDENTMEPTLQEPGPSKRARLVGLRQQETAVDPNSNADNEPFRPVTSSAATTYRRKHKQDPKFSDLETVRAMPDSSTAIETYRPPYSESRWFQSNIIENQNYSQPNYRELHSGKPTWVEESKFCYKMGDELIIENDNGTYSPSHIVDFHRSAIVFPTKEVRTKFHPEYRGKEEPKIYLKRYTPEKEHQHRHYDHKQLSELDPHHLLVKRNPVATVKWYQQFVLDAAKKAKAIAEVVGYRDQDASSNQGTAGSWYDAQWLDELPPPKGKPCLLHRYTAFVLIH